jgi:hypothetical protein
MLELVRGFGQLAYWVMMPDSEACGEELALPPVFRWRYWQPSDTLLAAFSQAVSSFRGEIGWEFSTSGQLWILMPARIREYAALHRCNGTLTAAGELKVSEPEFGKRANSELRLLAEHVGHYLKKVG